MAGRWKLARKYSVPGRAEAYQHCRVIGSREVVHGCGIVSAQSKPGAVIQEGEMVQCIAISRLSGGKERGLAKPRERMEVCNP